MSVICLGMLENMKAVESGENEGMKWLGNCKLSMKERGKPQRRSLRVGRV